MKKLHHVGILSSNINQSIDWFVECFGCSKPKVVEVEKPGFRLKSSMLTIGNGTYIQVIEPLEGPGLAELVGQGEGTLYEVAFEVENIEDFHDQLTARGLVATDFVGNPIPNKFLVASSGSKYFYLSMTQTRGTRIEIIQPLPARQSDTK